MSYNRRQFLKTGGVFASALAMGSTTDLFAAYKPLKQFGLQLYTLRDELPKDPQGVLKQVASFGYKQIEGYEGSKGIYWGMSNKEFKKFADDLGITMISTHCDINTNFERKAAEAGEIGMKYLISPYIGPQKTLDDYKKFADKFNSLGDICKKNGLRFAYHNHGYTFTAQDGVMPQDTLMQHTNPDTVDFEMDIYWVATPGEDPIAWLKKYPKRFRLCHVKDRQKGANPTQHDASVDLGTGSLDFTKILKEARKQGMEYYIVEQERYEGTTPLKAAATDAVYMKKLSI
ncbi:sugar phosphate isomerase/epimerase [Paraflavitalea soli]|uniref:Sugar phosphate isomerase/epimerase n=1 Tax=Paraflavitalea soli TaxID=2315862 RepID=A0A3B7MSF4_9BACT|nr:TIM barrel protein [Paraflavitalea soli]AXY76787.1 sugar phosphate isomerase/epimerase [Paraflavitalea soli]